jgi:phosphoribosylanthranilate isomerase
VLAGGINSENIKKAVSMNPWCIDVNSGVESSLALKDKTLIAEIIKKFKNG